MAKKILIVDDEPDIRESVKMLVESMGYKAKTADSGKKALKALQQEPFDLVLLDLLMPEMPGSKVLQNIRANPKTKNQKVALLTVVQLSEQGKEIAKKLKPVEYFQKPLIDKAEFQKRLKKILE